MTVGLPALQDIFHGLMVSGGPEGPKFERHLQIWSSQLIEIDCCIHVVKPHMKTFLGLLSHFLSLFCLKMNETLKEDPSYSTALCSMNTFIVWKKDL